MAVLCGVRSTELSLDEVMRAVQHPGAGAVVTFLGAVRDENEGRSVQLLEYEAYAPMAEKEMARAAAMVEAEIPGVRVAVLHRVGGLKVGEVAVVCAASAPHRDEAFQACRRLIDTIKAQAPIWKREHGPTGPYWVGWQDARCTGHAHEHPLHDNIKIVGSQSPTLNNLRLAVLTVSDTRNIHEDRSGARAAELLEAAGAPTVRRGLVRDEVTEIQAWLQAERPRVEAIIVTGGTGIAPRDVTCEAVTPLLERTLDGFGERFRDLSWRAVGARALLSRALAGTVGKQIIFVVPGNPHAVELAITELIIPVLPHALAILKGEGGHNLPSGATHAD